RARCVPRNSTAERTTIHIHCATYLQGNEGGHCGRAGVRSDDYLTKPFNAAEMRARLRTGERILNLEDRLVEAREEMRFKAAHDTLTSLWNRGAIMDLLGRELARSREGTSTTMLLGDSDHFKTV